jgi:hypothetical protein
LAGTLLEQAERVVVVALAEVAEVAQAGLLHGDALIAACWCV